uniref:Uncharacterized protein n=1 Tax=Arcella intermedia TaxID=1963864 RepID=A0A6B2L3I6_9EUKA
MIGYVPFAKANDSSQSPRGTPEVAVSSPSSLSPPTFDVDLCGSLFGLSLQPPHPKPIKTKPPTNPRSIGGYSIRPPSSETLLTPPPLRHSFNTTIGSPVYPSAESSSSSLFDSTSPISSFERATEPKSKPFSTVVGSPPKSRSQISDLLSSYPPPSKNTFPHQTRPLNSLHVSSNTPTSQTPNDSPLEGPPHKAPSLLTPSPPNISPSFSTNFNNFNAPAMNYFPPLREHTLNAPPFNPNPDMNYHLKYHPYDTYNPQNHFNIPQADYPKNSIPRTPSINLPNQDYDEPTDADFSYALDNEFQLQYSPHLETNEHIPMQNSYSYGIPSHSPLNVSANKPNHLKQMNGGLHKSEGGGVENQRKNLQGLGGSGGLFGTPLSASGMEGCNEQFARISQIWGESFSVDDMQNTWATSQAFNETRDRSARRFPSSF